MNINDYNPNDVGAANGNYFGMPFEPEDAALVLVSVPWDVTASYGGGQSYGPDAIIGASVQLDFYDSISPDQWRRGIATAPIDYSFQDKSAMLRGDAKRVIKYLEEGGTLLDSSMLSLRRNRVNHGSEEMNQMVYNQTKEWLDKGKLVGLVGGDHSIPLGFVKALTEKHGSIGILHIDAHCDLRQAYEGFTYSHASIMYNILNQIPAVEKIVQVGIRDYCDDEVALIANEPRVELFDDYSIAVAAFEGTPWGEQCRKIVGSLPQKVYISFDIDGLSAELCPNTGTPVAGGLTFNQALYLMDTVVRSGRQIVGFDVVEVVPGSSKESEWDANVGARILYKLCGLILKSN